MKMRTSRIELLKLKKRIEFLEFAVGCFMSDMGARNPPLVKAITEQKKKTEVEILTEK